MGANWTARKRDFGFKVVADPAEQNEQKQYIPEEGTGYSPAVGEETCRRVRPRRADSGARRTAAAVAWWGDLQASEFRQMQRKGTGEGDIGSFSSGGGGHW